MKKIGKRTVVRSGVISLIMGLISLAFSTKFNSLSADSPFKPVEKVETFGFFNVFAVCFFFLSVVFLIYTFFSTREG